MGRGPPRRGARRTKRPPLPVRKRRPARLLNRDRCALWFRKEMPAMRPASLPGVVLGGLALLAAFPPRARADEVPARYQAAVAKGLDWLARTQSKDGHWEA